MKTYVGTRETVAGCKVLVREKGRARPLPLRLKLFNHSPDGFEWGYGGSGPAQLALAILADHLRDDERAVRLHQRFKFKFVAGLPRDLPWSLTTEQLAEIVREVEAEV